MANHNRCKISTIFWLMLMFFFFTEQTRDTHALFGWFGKNAKEPSQAQSSKENVQKEVLGSTSRIAPKFDIETISILTDSVRGKQLYDKSIQIMSGNMCWHDAYTSLAANCRDILRDETQKSKMALRLTDCFMKASGRSGMKRCDESWPVASCVKALDDHTHAIFLAFYIDASTMCHHIQSQEFKMQTEKLVNDLQMAGDTTRSKLGSMSEQLDEQHAAVIKRSEWILDTQKKLQSEHSLLQANIEKGMGNLQEAADKAQAQLHIVTKYQKAIGEKQQELAESLASELYELQKKSNMLGSTITTMHESIEELTEKSLAGQEEAMKSLSTIQQSQIDAMEESKKSMQTLTDEAQRHQKEFQGWQYELNDMHDRLVDGSSKMIIAQDAFVTKQAAVFTTIERLFSLHNAIQLESRAVKTVMFYFALSMFVFMATNIKQIRAARLFLYFGLFLTMTFEIWLIRFKMNKLTSYSMQLVWPPKEVVWLRNTYLGVAFAYIIYTFLRFKDYEYLNYKMLKEIYGNFGNQTRLQGKLLEEYLARCQACKDLPEPRERANSSTEDEVEKEQPISYRRKVRSTTRPVGSTRMRRRRNDVG